MPSHCRHLILLCPLLLLTIFSHSQQRRQDTLFVHFRFDSHRIPSDERNSLLKSFRYPSVDSVIITGYTDKVGTAPYNQRLSEDRARAAADCLKSLHPNSAHPNSVRPNSAQTWKVLGGGIAPTPDRTDSDNRRVEVVVYYQIPDSAVTQPNPANQAAPTHHDTISRSPRNPNVPTAPPTHPNDSIVVVKQGPGGNPTPDSTQPAAVLALHRINFIVDTPVPTDSTRSILPQLIAELQQYKDRHLEIDGYVNSLAPLHGPTDPLFKLSVNRAKFIYNCLVEAGFNSANLTYKGLGNSTPVNPHPRTRDEMNANMRVEIKVF